MAAKSPVQNCVADGCLACADRLAAAGKPDEADEAGFLCRVVMESMDAMDKKDVPKYLRVAAVRGLFRYAASRARWTFC